MRDRLGLAVIAVVTGIFLLNFHVHAGAAGFQNASPRVTVQSDGQTCNATPSCPCEGEEDRIAVTLYGNPMPESLNSKIPTGNPTPPPGTTTPNPDPGPPPGPVPGGPTPSQPTPAVGPLGASLVPALVPANSTSACMPGDAGVCTSPSDCSGDCVNVTSTCQSNPGVCTSGAPTDAGYQLMMTASSPGTASRASVERRRARESAKLMRHGPQPGELRLASYRSSSAFAGLPPETLLAAPAPQASNRGLDIALVATGNSSGDAFQLQVRDASGKIKQVALPEGVVLEPVRKGASKAPVSRAGSGMISHEIGAFCLEYVHLPPGPGMTYQIASPAAQQRFAPLRLVLQAGRTLTDSGKLHPDSDPQAYAESIRQYAVWSKQEGWDEKQFEDHFIERTRKNAEARKVTWTPQLENSLRIAAPGRWRDISQVLDLARTWQGAQP